MASARVDVGFNSGSDSEMEDDYLSGHEDSAEDHEDSAEDHGTDTPQEKTNTGGGITDVMAKILNTVPSKKGAILAKGQTDKEIKRKKKQKEKENKGEGKQVNKKKKSAEDGEDSSSDWTDDSDEDARKSYLQMKKRREWNNLGRVKPSVLNREKERMLQRIATRGVVQVFNAVRQQQNIVEEKLSEAGSSVRRRDKVMGSISKRHFLDLLDNTQAKSGTETKDKTVKNQAEEEAEQAGGKWSILRDDYMMKARMKDWDRDSDNDDNDDR